jgi:hypothetical protein
VSSEPKRQDLNEALSMAQERRINLRFSPEKFNEIDEKRFKERTSFQEIGIRLFEEWLTGQHPEPKALPPKPMDPLLEKVDIIRASGNPTLLAIVRKAVEASYGLLQHSLSAEQIEHLRAANRDSGLAGRHRRDEGTAQIGPGTGKGRRRESA